MPLNLHQILISMGKNPPVRILLFLAMVACFASCNRQAEQQDHKIDREELSETLIEANKKIVLTEDEQIEDLLDRYKWEMETSETGLRYIVDDPGTGRRIEEGDEVTLLYKTRLITGDVIYTSDEDGPLTFTVGRSDVIAGLQEGVKLLGLGGQARLVIPSYLGYGLIGDQGKIKGKATLIYRIEVIGLNN